MKLKAIPRLHAVMKDKGWTQVRLAEASGVPQGSISRFDKNTRHEDWHVFSIAKALEVEVEELFEIEDATEEDVGMK
ncbi:helix-turn-helix domain-containing protein [Bacillus subtilis]|nr:helix-turn-helix transcriptional regulator [Bacillus subtilis]